MGYDLLSNIKLSLSNFLLWPRLEELGYECLLQFPKSFLWDSVVGGGRRPQPQPIHRFRPLLALIG